MAKRKSTKRALLCAIMSLIMCCTMLLGVTFAWLTDSVAVKNQMIVAGNLDVKLYYARPVDANGNAIKNASDLNWVEVNSGTEIFDDEARWEPGYTEFVYFKIENAGEMALKYKFYVDVVNEDPGYSVLGTDFYLSQFLRGHVTDSNTADKDGNLNYMRESYQYMDGDFSLPLGWPLKDNYYNMENGVVLDGGEATSPIAMAIWMPTTVGNEANAGVRPGETVVDTASLELGITLVAAQAEAEEDAYGTDYDRFAQYGDPAASDGVREVVTFKDADANGDIKIDGNYAFKNLVVGSGMGDRYNNVTYTGIADEVALVSNSEVTVKGDLKVDLKENDQHHAANTFEIVGFRVLGDIIVNAGDIDNVIVRNCEARSIQIVGFNACETADGALTDAVPAVTVDRCTIKGIGTATASGNEKYGVYMNAGEAVNYKLAVTNSTFSDIAADAIYLDGNGGKETEIVITGNTFVSYGSAAFQVIEDANLCGKSNSITTAAEKVAEGMKNGNNTFPANGNIAIFVGKATITVQ